MLHAPPSSYYPALQWLDPAAYADLSFVVLYEPDAALAAPAAYLWAEHAPPSESSSARTPIAPYAAAVLVVSRAFADAALAKAAAAVNDGAALPAGWRVAESDEEAAELAAADRSGSSVAAPASAPEADGDGMDVDEVEVVMPGAQADAAAAAPTLLPGVRSPADAALLAPPEFVFVIDCSGSMGGSRIKAARAALQARQAEAGQVLGIPSPSPPGFPPLPVCSLRSAPCPRAPASRSSASAPTSRPSSPRRPSCPRRRRTWRGSRSCSR